MLTLAGHGRKPKKQHAPHGSGSIWWNPKRKRFEGKIRLIDTRGQRVRPTFYGKTRSEVREQFEQAKRDVADGLILDADNLTVEEHFEEWLRERRRKIAPNTASKYTNHTSNHIIPSLGRVKLADLNYRHINRFYSYLESKGLSPTTQADVASVLSMGLNDAVRKGLIRENPALKVTRPQADDEPARFLTPDEWRLWQEAARGERLEEMYHLAYWTGLRPSELLGLPWKSADLERRTLTVAQALHESGELIWIGKLKTKTSYRTISLSDEAMAALKRQRARQLAEKLKAGPKWRRPAVKPPYSNDLVFATADGNWLRRSTIYKYDLARVRERTSLHDVGLHTFRHTHAAVLIHMGATALEVQERLGHKDVAFTLKKYGHLFPGADGRAARLLDDFARRLAQGEE